MGQYYIRTEDGLYFELDATTEINTVFTGQATEFSIEDGKEVADHYISKNTRITFTGVVSDIKAAGNLSRSLESEFTSSTKPFVEGLVALKNSRIPFTVYYGNLNPLENCIFENLEVKQDQKHGYADGLSSYVVTFTAKQLRFGEGARIVATPAEEVSDTFAQMTSAAGNTQSVRAGSREEETVRRQTREELINERWEVLRQLSGGW